MEINEKVLELKVRESELKEQLAHYENMVPVNNMGKWYVSIRIDKINNKIKSIEKELKTKKKRLEP